MKRDISKIYANGNNPRIIKDYKFQQLVESIKEFPEMLELRPIIVNEAMIVLGGNMRLKACEKAGLKEVPIKIATGLTPEQEKEFIIKDNVGFGKWDWDILANEWESSKLNEWGMDVWNDDINLDDFFEEKTGEEKITQTEWYERFVDYIQKNYTNAYNEACKYADE
tara:strand:+ start:1466 stop:1966 length:501 start_codon:yes stop_codon:yes gene_type:complete